MPPLPMQPAFLTLPWPAPRNAGAARDVIPVFLPFRGCPARCVFCAQDVQTGLRAGQSPTCSLRRMLDGARADLAARTARRRAGENVPPAELAFYGGTFTAMPDEDQRACLQLAATALAQGQISAFRCSTRPDCLSPAVLARLRAAGCETVELGVQSFSDAALAASRRGYTGTAALEGCVRIRDAGLRLGVQLLPGMPGCGPEVFLADVALALDGTKGAGADLLRFYPCLVLEGTILAQLWRAGRYRPWSLESTLEALARGWLAARTHGVPVIRMGLAPEPELARAVLAGPMHPALGSRIMGRALHMYVSQAVNAACSQLPCSGVDASVLVSSSSSSSSSLLFLEAPRACQGYFWGFKGELRPAWAALGITPGRVCFTKTESIRLWTD